FKVFEEFSQGFLRKGFSGVSRRLRVLGAQAGHVVRALQCANDFAACKVHWTLHLSQITL
ncbi:hypothetical protein, partial [Gardnerella pickettii]